MPNIKVGAIMVNTGRLANVANGTMGLLAKKTFEYHNPEIDLFYIEEPELIELSKKYEDELNKLSSYPFFSRFRWWYAYKLLKEKTYDKVIILGADTISFGPCTELYDHKGDIGVTLDYDYANPYNGIMAMGINGKLRHTHLNADVICFSNYNIIWDILNCNDCPVGGVYLEQGPLNYVYASNSYEYKFDIIDYPFGESYYNVPSKGTEYETHYDRYMYKDPEKFFIKDNNVYHPDGTRIKIFHFCDGLSKSTQFKFMCSYYFEKMFSNEIVTHLENQTNIKLKGIWHV